MDGPNGDIGRASSDWGNSGGGGRGIDMDTRFKQGLAVASLAALKQELAAAKYAIKYWHSRSDRSQESEAKERLAYIQKLLDERRRWER